MCRLPTLEIGDRVRFIKVPVRQPFPIVFRTLGISHYLAEFHSHNQSYLPFSIGFYPIIKSSNQLLVTTIQSKPGRLISPDPFYSTDCYKYLTNCNEPNTIIEYSLDREMVLKINRFLENATDRGKRSYISTEERYSMLPTGNNIYNCRTWLFHYFPALHRDAWCHSKYYQLIQSIQKIDTEKTKKV